MTDREDLRAKAMGALEGVGDKSKGEWHQFTGYAYHVRRRLSESEQASVGPALDLTGTSEGWRRYRAMRDKLPQPARQMAAEEIGAR